MKKIFLTLGLTLCIANVFADPCYVQLSTNGSYNELNAYLQDGALIPGHMHLFVDDFCRVSCADADGSCDDLYHEAQVYPLTGIFYNHLTYCYVQNKRPHWQIWGEVAEYGSEIYPINCADAKKKPLRSKHHSRMQFSK